MDRASRVGEDFAPRAKRLIGGDQPSFTAS